MTEYQNYMQGMRKADQKNTEEILKAAQNIYSSRNLEYFASKVLTKDEHKTGEESVRPFPTREEKPYIWYCLDCLQAHDELFIEKSRQLMFTWALCLYCYWTAKYQKNRLNFVQSKKEENAANLVFNTEPNQARISFMEMNLPKHMQSITTMSYGKIIFHETGSTIRGIPEGGDQIRSYVPSFLLSDEAAFQPEFENAWSAAKPCIEGGGKVAVVSTAKSGAYMKQQLKTTGTGNAEFPMKGVKKYTSDSGLTCLRVHYTADPMKDPATEAGKIWIAKASKGYKGGIKSSEWRREMEIDWDTSGGDLVFPQLEDYEHVIVIPPHTVPESWDLFGSFDYGHRNPSSFHVYGLDHDSDVNIIWEYYMAGQGYKNTARAIRACPYFDRLKINPLADPSIWSATQQVADSDENVMKSVAQLFWELPEDLRIIFMPAKKGGDITVAEMINGDMWNEHDLKAGKSPRIKIFSCCPMIIWELKKLRYKDWSATVQEGKNIQEDIVDRDNHAFDDFKMFLTMFFVPSELQESEDPKMKALKEADRASYEEWKRVQQMHGEKKEASATMGDF